MPDKINEQHTFAPHDVAGMLGISAMTVRRWADYHREHFSEVANPIPGRARAYTWADVEKFRQIKALRDSGLSIEAINNTLSSPLSIGVNHVSLSDQLTVLQVAQDGQGVTSGDMVVSSLINAIDSLQRRIDSLEIQRQEPAVVPEYLVAMQRLVEALEQSRQAPDELTVGMTRRLEAVEQTKVNDRRLVRDGVFMFMAGAIVMGVVILLFVAIVWLYGK